MRFATFLATFFVISGPVDGKKRPTQDRCHNGFKYPDELVPPSHIWVEGFASRLHAQNIQKYETPIQVWQTWRIDQLMWNCIAAFHPTALDALTYQRPEYVGDPQHFTSEARALTIMHAMNKLIPELVPISTDIIKEFLESVGLCSDTISGKKAKEMYRSGKKNPKVIGTIIASEIIKDMKKDGWNYHGKDLPNGEECVANCRAFRDTYGYVPVNSPWELDDATRWQPLMETDEIGFFYTQEHVTPHIGFMVDPVILTKEEYEGRSLGEPDYDYGAETEFAINNVKDIAGDSDEAKFKRDMIRFMDNKINIAGGMIMRLRGKYNLSLEAQVFYHYGYTSSEIDVVLLAWREKILRDRVRPTSLVQALGDVEVESYAGTHPARDWHPFIRVMPHAEYPSGSGCICLAVAQFVDAFVQDAYGASSIETTWDFPESGPYTFQDMDELRTICGESRLWGGMHFSLSVPDSYDLCDGVGTLGYTRLVKPLLGTGTYRELLSSEKDRYCSDTSGDLFCE